MNSRSLVLLVAMFGNISVFAADHHTPLITLYQDLHAHPELSFQEKNTAARIASELESAGFAVTRNIGGHGVVGLLKNGPGPTIMLRTDLDGLPVKELTGLAYASQAQAIEQTGQEVSVMHACGHDIHMTTFIGTARALAADKDQWSGTLMMVAQPAEERGAGARAMLEDGLFERFPRPDFNLALHVSAEYPAGTVKYVPGWAMANVDSVDISVRGIGGHGAYPHTTRDPIVLASSIVMNLQTLISRELNPAKPAVITVGSIHGGSKHNVISDRVDLQLTVRSYSDEVRDALLDGIRRVAVSQARALGFPEDKLPIVTVREEYTPAVFNNPELTARLADVFRGEFGADKVSLGTASMGGEDFARYSRVEPAIPSVLFWLGAVKQSSYDAAQNGGPALPSLHSAYFAPDPVPTIKAGVAAMTSAAMDLLDSK
ncbi:MAG: amidohydrolase [Halioglobus sp.]